jgi:hypothetical protein
MARPVARPDDIAGSSLLMGLFEAAWLAADLVLDASWLASHV